MSERNNQGNMTMEHLKSFLDIPDFEIAKKRLDVLKYLRSGVFEEIPFRVFGKKPSFVLTDDRVILCIQTPNSNDGENIGEFHLDMTPEERKGLWRLIDKSRKETNKTYKKISKSKIINIV